MTVIMSDSSLFRRGLTFSESLEALRGGSHFSLSSGILDALNMANDILTIAK